MVMRASLVFVLDASLLAAICATEVVRLTGLAVHEWLSIAFAAAALLHLLLSWRWIEKATRRIFSRAELRNTVNYTLNFILFADIVILFLSGIMISRVAVPTIGMHI